MAAVRKAPLNRFNQFGFFSNGHSYEDYFGESGHLKVETTLSGTIPYGGNVFSGEGKVQGSVKFNLSDTEWWQVNTYASVSAPFTLDNDYGYDSKQGIVEGGPEAMVKFDWSNEIHR